jgi:DNA repair exonuclease SbcCD ATPase subunit
MTQAKAAQTKTAPAKTEPSSPAEWQQALDDLKQRRAQAQDHVADLARQREEIAFGAEYDDALAKKAEELRDQSARATAHLEDVDHAISRAERGLSEALQAQDEQTKAQHRRKATKHAQERVQAAQDVDAALAKLDDALARWEVSGTRWSAELRRAGLKAPSEAKLQNSEALLAAATAAGPRVLSAFSIPRPISKSHGSLAGRERALTGLNAADEKAGSDAA